mmetsp:Transcript_1707/g.3953  ORF Transcript_1707/g.3953 Transcript_1707/m.3953 type:complete len:274 (-) Transcript_1707:107-928(-)
MRRNQDDLLPGDLGLQERHHSDAVLEDLLPNRAELVDKLNRRCLHQVKQAAPPCHATTVVACRSRPLAPGGVVAQLLQRRPEVVVVVVALHQRQQIAVHLTDLVEQTVLSHLPREATVVCLLHSLNLLRRQNALHIVGPSWVGRLSIWEPFPVQPENLFPSFRRHVYTVQKPRLHVASHVAGQDVILTHRELQGLSPEDALESLELLLRLLQARARGLDGGAALRCRRGLQGCKKCLIIGGRAHGEVLQENLPVLGLLRQNPAQHLAQLARGD